MLAALYAERFPVLKGFQFALYQGFEDPRWKGVLPSLVNVCVSRKTPNESGQHPSTIPKTDIHLKYLIETIAPKWYANHSLASGVDAQGGARGGTEGGGQ